MTSEGSHPQRQRQLSNKDRERTKEKLGTRNNPGQQGKISQSIKRGQSKRDAAPSSKKGDRKSSTPRQVWRKKTKDQASPAHQPKPASLGQAEPAPLNQAEPVSPELATEHTTLIAHITWPGFDQTSELVEQTCNFCTGDLSYEQTEDDGFEYYDGLLDEPLSLPEVAVLSCGHVFHSQCLRYFTPEEQSIDPPCFLCSLRNES